MTQGYSGGESGSLGGALTWKPGDLAANQTQFLTPTQFYMAESSTLDSVIEHKEHDVLAGPGRDIDQGHRSGKSTTSGQISGGLYPDNMYELLVGGIGTDQLVTALSADTTVSIATAAGISTIVLTTGGSIAYGDLLTIDTGAVLEVRAVQTYNSGTKTATVAALKYTHTSAGTAVTKVAQHKARPYTEVDGTGYSRVLRRFALEEAEGVNYAWRYVNCEVSKIALKGSSSKFETAFDMVSSADRILANGQGSNPAMSAFSRDASWSNLAYEYVDGFLTMPIDPADTGTATLQKSIDGEDWEVDLDNGHKIEMLFDEQRSGRWFPHGRKVTVKFKLLNTASRPVGWTDFLSKDLNVQFTAQMYYIDGGVPFATAICLPNLRYTKSTPIKGLNTVIGEQIEAEAIAVGSTPKIFVTSLNSFVAAV